MSKSVVVTARISEELLSDLDRLATMRDRSRAWIIEQAIAEFVRDDLELRDALAQADDEVERGEFVEHDQAMAELRAKHRLRQAA